MENQIISLASVGAEMQDLLRILLLADIFKYGVEYKVESIRKKIGENDFEKRVAYEVSVSKLEYLEEF